MLLNRFKNFILLALTTFLIFYLIVAGINLGLRLTATRQPECNPLFCKELINEASYCLISTPGAENCLKISGWFFIVSKPLAYILLAFSFVLSYVINKRFYIVQWLIILGLLAVLIFTVRVFLGAASFSYYGIIFEAQKMGLY